MQLLATIISESSNSIGSKIQIFEIVVCFESIRHQKDTRIYQETLCVSQIVL